MTQVDQNVTGDGNQVIGQVVGDVIDSSQTIHHHHAAAPPPKERPRGEKILLKTVRSEVWDRLDQSLHNALFINLPKESQPEQVERPWDFEVKVGDRDSQALPSEQTIVDVFDDEEVDSKLLILGHPGSGKTTSLLDLAKTLLTRAEKSAEVAVPVLFNLSSWVEDKQSISDWLKQELKSKYGVSHKLGQLWLEQQRLMLLLDGLDELAPGRQELCIQRLNEWLTSGTGAGALVVCSRIEEYESCETELALRGAVCLQPFSDQQIEQYLREIGKPELQAAVANNAELREMMRVPLHTSMAVLVYDTAFALQWRQLRTSEEQLSLLLNAYVAYMINRKLTSAQLQKVGYPRQKPPSTAKTQQYLKKLSEELKKESKDEFLIEQTQLTWLTTAKQKKAYKILLFLCSIPGFMILTVLIGQELQSTVLESLMFTSFAFLFVGICCVIWDDRENESQIDFSHYEILSSSAWAGFLKSLWRDTLKAVFPENKLFFQLMSEIKKGILLGTFVGFCLIAFHLFSDEIPDSLGAHSFFLNGFLNNIKELLSTTRPELLFSASIAMSLAVIWGFRVFDYICSVMSPVCRVLLVVSSPLMKIEEINTALDTIERDVPIPVKPNEIVLRSRNLLLVWILGIIAIALIVDLVFVGRWFEAENGGINLFMRLPNLPLFIDVWIAFFLARILNGESVVKHFLLRFVLWATGQIPWNYSRFLDYCTELLLIQRVGGRYRFIHKRLQEHFAAMPLEESLPAK